MSSSTLSRPPGASTWTVALGGADDPLRPHRDAADCALRHGAWRRARRRESALHPRHLRERRPRRPLSRAPPRLCRGHPRTAGGTAARHGRPDGGHAALPSRRHRGRRRPRRHLLRRRRRAAAAHGTAVGATQCGRSGGDHHPSGGPRGARAAGRRPRSRPPPSQPAAALAARPSPESAAEGEEGEGASEGWTAAQRELAACFAAVLKVAPRALASTATSFEWEATSSSVCDSTTQDRAAACASRSSRASSGWPFVSSAPSSAANRRPTHTCATAWRGAMIAAPPCSLAWCTRRRRRTRPTRSSASRAPTMWASTARSSQGAASTHKSA